jgi:two-component system, OmpR family, phosphate regulon sensor histidine kinase PhoR
MTIFAFIFGVIFGLSVCYWQISRLNRELKRTLISLSDTVDLSASFPVTSLVRRELQFLSQRLRERENSLAIQKSLLERAPIAYLHVDADNQLLWCNQQAITLLKLDRWQPEQVRLLLELVRSYELDQLIQETRQKQSTQVQTWTFYPTNYPLTAVSDRQVVAPKSIVLKGYGYPLLGGEIGVFIENKQPLVELSQNRERAFSDLTHELRTPLTSISLITEALQKRLQEPERRWLEQMAKEVERLSQLVRDWLEISELQADAGRSLQYQTINLQDLIIAAWQSVTPLAEKKQISLNYSPSGDGTLEADHSRLLQVFLNLFDNAIKYSPSPGEISLEIQDISDTMGEKWLKIDVIDSGKGFNEADLPYVFERLFRGDPSRTRLKQGSKDHSTGLGLSISQEIIQAHGGSIIAKNDPNTGGGCIQVILPRQKISDSR